MWGTQAWRIRVLRKSNTRGPCVSKSRLHVTSERSQKYEMFLEDMRRTSNQNWEGAEQEGICFSSRYQTIQMSGSL